MAPTFLFRTEIHCRLLLLGLLKSVHPHPYLHSGGQQSATQLLLQVRHEALKERPEGAGALWHTRAKSVQYVP